MSQKLCGHKDWCWKHALKGFVKATGQGLLAKSALFVLLQVLLRRGYRNPSKALQQFLSLDTLRFGVFTGLMNGCGAKIGQAAE